MIHVVNLTGIAETNELKAVSIRLHSPDAPFAHITYQFRGETQPDIVLDLGKLDDDQRSPLILRKNELEPNVLEWARSILPEVTKALEIARQN